MIALLAAIAVAGAPAKASGQTAPSSAAKLDPYTAQEIAYGAAAIGKSGWSLISVTRDFLIYSKPYAAPSGKTAKVWLRVEHYPLASGNPLGAGESFVSVREVDCTLKRSRTVSSTLYSGPDMGGSIVAASDQPSGWIVTRAGDLAAVADQSACSPEPAPATPKPTSALPTGR